MTVRITISSQQCKRARAALKWNVQDLSSHTRVPAHQIEKFERNQYKLMRFENDEILDAFDKEGVHFLASGEVRLKGKAAHSIPQGTAAEQEVYNLDESFLPPVPGEEARPGEHPHPRLKPII